MYASKGLVLILASLALVACSSTTYKEYVGGKEIVGQGGTREAIEGVDVWENGAPNRAFRVIGIIDDERGNGVIPRRTRLADIANKAKQAGGDAVILYEEGSQVSGVLTESYSSLNGSTLSTSGYTTPVTRLKTKAAVVKYTR